MRFISKCPASRTRIKTRQKNKPDEPLTPEIDPALLTLLSGFARKMSGAPGDASDLGYRFQRAVKLKDWDEYSKGLNQLYEKFVRAAANAPAKPIALVDMPSESEQLHYLRDLLVRTLSFTVASLLQDAPDMAADAEALAALLKNGAIKG